MNKPQNLNEYVLTLRKFNPTVSDVNLTLYLSSLGYSPEEIMGAFVEGEPRLTSGTDDLELKEGQKETPRAPVVEFVEVAPAQVQITPTPILTATQPIFVSTVAPTVASNPIPTPIPTLSPFPKVVQVNRIETPIFIPSTNLKPLSHYVEPNFTSPSERKETFPFVSLSQTPIGAVRKAEPVKSPFDYPKIAEENFPQKEISSSAFVPPTEGKIFLPKDFNSFQKRDEIPVKKSGSIISKIFTTFFTLLILSGLAYGYFEFVDGIYVRAKAPYEKETVFGDGVKKISEVKSLSIKSDISFSISNKEANTALFDVRKYNNSEFENFSRDELRFKDLANISTKLSSYFVANKKYPASLTAIEVPILDPSGKPYQYKPALLNKVPVFSIPVEFETFEGVLASKGYATTVEEKKALFTDKNMPPFYVLPIVPKTYVFADWFTTLGGELSSLPLDSSLSLLASGFLKNFSGETEGKLSITTSYKGGEFDLSGGMEILKDKDDSFTKFKGLSFLFFENSKLDEKWVKISKDKIPDNPNLKSYADVLFSKDVSGIKEQIKTVLKIAQQENLFIAENEPKRVIEKFDAFYSYDLVLNKKAVPMFYERAGKELSLKFKEKALFVYDENTKRQIQDKMFTEFLDFVSKNSKVTFVVDKDGFLSFIDLKLVLPIVSPESNIYKQANFSIKTNFNNFGKEQVTEKPTNFLEGVEALSIINGS